ncbi:MAG: SurA N-terminal domain-containing protein [Elusimicrobiales bacterium]
MITFFYKHKRIIYIAVIATFMAGIFVGLGSYLGSGSATMDLAARVGGLKITNQEFYRQYNRRMEMLTSKGLTEIPDNLRKTIQKQVLEELVVEKILGAGAREYDMSTGDFEVAAIVQNLPMFQREGKFNPELYARGVAYAYKMQPVQFENELRAERDASKFRSLIIAAAKVTPQELDAAYAASGRKPGKDPKKDKAEFAQEIVRAKAGGMINTYLNSYIATGKFEEFLSKREQGI